MCSFSRRRKGGGKIVAINIGLGFNVRFQWRNWKWIFVENKLKYYAESQLPTGFYMVHYRPIKKEWNRLVLNEELCPVK